MSLPEIVSYDKDGRIERFPLYQKLFLSITVILVALLSFGIGRLSMTNNREPIKIDYDSTLTEQSIPSVSQSASVINIVKEGSVVASKSGTRYHYPYCAGAKQIKEENKIIFPTQAAAEAAGYSLATNCKPR